jgi:hypothetical protein
MKDPPGSVSVVFMGVIEEWFFSMNYHTAQSLRLIIPYLSILQNGTENLYFWENINLGEQKHEIYP